MPDLSSPLPPPVIVLAGPTGVGKSKIAGKIAQEHNCVIINADSRQVYADFPVITAQPDQVEQSLAPHKLYAFLACEEKCNAAQYANYARREILLAREAGKIPLLVGGTGLYLQTLLAGLSPIPAVDSAVTDFWRRECADKGPQELHNYLQTRDAKTAAKLHPNDSQRITRALAVLTGTGRPLSCWQSLPPQKVPYRVLPLYLDLPLEAITPRLEARINSMIEQGAVEEARLARERCNNSRAPGWSGIGCAELFTYLEGKTDFANCKKVWLAHTRAYAKRQITWFKRDLTLRRVPPQKEIFLMDICRHFLDLHASA
ncbi:tRNA dimethylallyltransferase [Deltaproteobacteria bacterium]|nr:tRNA dimethylallyltransferase [Deltaproteobacteria bacterium]